MLNIFSYFLPSKRPPCEGAEGCVIRKNLTRVLQRLFQDRTRVRFWKFALLALLFLPLSASATTGWTTDATTCDSSYLSIDCPENLKICGYVSSTLYCANPTTVNNALPVSGGVADNKDVQGAGGYQVNCTQSVYNCSAPASLWECKASSTCVATNLKTICTGSAHTKSCSTCLTGYLDCDGGGTGLDPNGCEIQIGGACTNNGVAGTYDTTCQGSTPPVCNTGAVDLYTGTFAEQSTTDPLFWGKQYGTGDLFNVSKNGGNSVVIDNSGNVGIGTITPSEKLDVALNAGEKEIGRAHV